MSFNLQLPFGRVKQGLQDQGNFLDNRNPIGYTKSYDKIFPGSGLHPLLPKTKGRWAIKVSGNWRLTFEFKDGDALNVDIEDPGGTHIAGEPG